MAPTNFAYRIFTNLAVEAGLINCRSLLEFLGVENRKYPNDVVITMFQRPNGENLSSVPLSTVAKLHPPGFSESETLAALQFTKQAAHKAVAHLTLGPPQPEGDQVKLFQLACYAIREAVRHHLYEELGLPAPERIIEDIKRGESKLS